MKEIAAGHGLQIDGDGEQTRDFIYVGDLCRAIELALESEVSGEVFQIATGIETSIRALAGLIEQVLGKRLSTQYVPARQGDVRRSVSTIEKARVLLSWRPEFDLLQGLNETWKWFQREPGVGMTQSSPASSMIQLSRSPTDACIG
jgi:UDP-glucose 4-epimerase